MPTPPPTLSLKDFRRVHPAWLARRASWLEIRDVTEGALDDKAKLKEYVPKGEREWESDYATRLRLTEFVPECIVASQRIVGALYSQRISRDLSKVKALADWAISVDGRGHGLDDYGETRIAPLALHYGACHVLVESPNGPEEVPQDRAEQQARGKLLPYLCAYSPLEVRNWCVGEDGSLDWVVIVEDELVESGPAGARVPTRCYRFFDRFGWSMVRTRPKTGSRFRIETWDPVNGEPIDDARSAQQGEEEVEVERADSGTIGHGSPGTVPLVSFIPDLIEGIIGHSAIRAALKLDLKRLRLDSDLQWDLFVHAHPELVLKTGRDLSSVGAGSNQAIKLNPEEKEDAFYLTLPSESFQARERALTEAKIDVHRVMGMDPLGVVSGDPQAASGVARAYSFTTSEARHLGRVASRFEDGEMELARVVAQFLKVDPPPEGAIRWPEEFDSTTASSSIEDAIALPSAVTSPTALKLVQKRLVRKMLGEIEPDVAKQIDDEIDAAEAPMGAAPAAMTP